MLDIKQAKAGSAVGMEENNAWMHLVISGYQKCNQTLIIRTDSKNDPFTNGGVTVTTVCDGKRKHQLIDPVCDGNRKHRLIVPVRVTNNLTGKDKLERILWPFVPDFVQSDQHKGLMPLFGRPGLAIGYPNKQAAVTISSYIIRDAIIMAHELNKANLEIKLDDGLLTIDMGTTEVNDALDSDQAVDCMVHLMKRIRANIRALR